MFYFLFPDWGEKHIFICFKRSQQKRVDFHSFLLPIRCQLTRCPLFTVSNEQSLPLSSVVYYDHCPVVQYVKQAILPFVADLCHWLQLMISHCVIFFLHLYTLHLSTYRQPVAFCRSKKISPLLRYEVSDGMLLLPGSYYLPSIKKNSKKRYYKGTVSPTRYAI